MATSLGKSVATSLSGMKVPREVKAVNLMCHFASHLEMLGAFLYVLEVC